MSAPEPKPDTMLLLGNIHTSGECITMRAQMDNLDDVIGVFERFLIAVGFELDGQLVILCDPLHDTPEAPGSNAIN